MSILFLANSAVELGGNTEASTVVDSFDPAYASESARVGILYTSGSNGFNIPLSAYSGDLWVHFRFRTPTGEFGSASSDGYWLSFYDVNKVLIARIEMTDAIPYAEVYGDTTVSGSTFGWGQNSTLFMDLKLEIGANITFSVYVNGVLQSTATAANTGAKGPPTTVSFEHEDMSFASTGTPNSYCYYSEVVVTDGEPTIGWRVAEMKPASVGNYTEWVGGFEALGDGNTATSASSATAAQRVSWTPSAYAGAATPSSIRGVFATALGGKGPAGPQGVKHFLRIGGADYDGTTLTPDGETALIEDWTINPATGAAWTVADLATFEAGLLSVT